MRKLFNPQSCWNESIKSINVMCFSAIFTNKITINNNTKILELISCIVFLTLYFVSSNDKYRKNKSN